MRASCGNNKCGTVSRRACVRGRLCAIKSGTSNEDTLAKERIRLRKGKAQKNVKHR